MLRTFALTFILFLAACASSRVYTEADAPPQRDPRIEQMPVPEFLRPGSTAKNPNLEQFKARLLPERQAAFVPIQLSEKQKLVTAQDLREISALLGRIRPAPNPHVIRQISMTKPEDGLWVLLEVGMAIQLYLVEGEWVIAGSYILQH